MKRTALILALLLALVGATPALASPGSFTLAQAHQTAASYEASFHFNPPPAVFPCHWMGSRHRVAECLVLLGPVAIIDGEAPTSYFAWNELVTRSGPCQLTSNEHSDAGWHNCFTGPLVASMADFAQLG